jgi:hypothetical protein
MEESQSMHFNRLRIKLAAAMLAVGIAAVVLALERLLFHNVAEAVRSGDEQYICSEAVTVWVLLNIALSLPIGLIAVLIRVVVNDITGARRRIR